MTTAAQFEPTDICQEAFGTGQKVVGNVVKHVKVLGPVSKNFNRRYSAEVMQRAAPKYEGVRVNLDHTQTGREPRSVRDRFGVFKNPKAEAEGVFADFHFNPKHAFAEQFIWAVENEPSSLGFSHVAVLKERRTVDGLVVEEIQRVKSVDLVADPATTGGVFEDVDPLAEEIPQTGRSRALSGLADDAFAYVEPGGKKDAGGRTTPRSKRLFPLDNADNVRAALNAIPRTMRLDSAAKEKAMARAQRAAARFRIGLPQAATTNSEDEDMANDLATLTLEDLQSVRPDLVDKLNQQGNQAAEIASLKAKVLAQEGELKTFKDDAAKRARGEALDKLLVEADIDPKNPKHLKPSQRRLLLAIESQEELAEAIAEHAELLEEAGLIGEGAEAAEGEDDGADEIDMQARKFGRAAAREARAKNADRPQSRMAQEAAGAGAGGRTFQQTSGLAAADFADGKSLAKALKRR